MTDAKTGDPKFSRPPRKDRDDFVLVYLRKHPELVPTSAAFGNYLPKESIETLRLALIREGWNEYGPGHDERSKLPATCLRSSLDRLRRSEQLPQRIRTNHHATGQKVAPKAVAAKTITAKVVVPPSQEINRAAIIIEAARTGLKVRLLPDGTIEVLP